MEFDKQYFDARAEAVRWLQRDYDRRDYAVGLDILERLRFKPLLLRRLRMHPGNATLKAVLVQAVRDGVNVYRNPTASKFADVVPAEVENIVEGARQTAAEEKQLTETETAKMASYPPVVKNLVRWFAQAYKQRDKLFKQMVGIGETNDADSMARRQQLSDQIASLTDYMDLLYPLQEEYTATGTLPDAAALAKVQPFDTFQKQLRQQPASGASEGSGTSTLPATGYARDEDFGRMSPAELRVRRHSIRTMLRKKQNQLLYQSDRKEEKENPMPPCPLRTKTEVQVRVLTNKLYQADKALAKFGL